ncbi:ProQ/FinO family protein [Lamprobacter modestohalophilus]|uniref:ProQ/FinO family protein n=1 Tax=Lamprobacter modestohalophilus TaxID=1064514 RepID=UPI002ADEAC94|nr:ProQ/FinO family protein [Lamprobacter modestohalophilus]MEA1053100.1 ProQ/FinO family protein [Lamprobacter modestohalophilus]
MTDPEQTTSEPEQATPTTPRALPEGLEPLDLLTHFPACFDLAQPRPLKIKINKDMIKPLAAELIPVEGTNRQQRQAAKQILHTLIIQALADYCSRPAYLQATLEGAPRIAIDGTVAGEVSAHQAKYAAAVLRGKTPPMKPPSAGPKTPPTRPLPKDAPLTEDAIVPGRLELTLKFNQLPKAVPIKDGMKIGIQTDNALVVATLRPKAWKKLTKGVVPAMVRATGASTGKA